MTGLVFPADVGCVLTPPSDLSADLFRDNLGLNNGRRKQRNKRTEARAAVSVT
jgi:hypothetical protein